MTMHQNNTTYQDRADAMFSGIAKDYHTGIDTTIFLIEPEARQAATFRNLDNAQLTSDAVFWTTEDTLAEVKSKFDSPRPGLAKAAKAAWQQIEKMVDEHRLIIYQTPNRRRFADAAFLARLVENCPDVPIALLTLDSDLAVSMMNVHQNIAPSVHHKPIAVFRVNGSGNPAWFNFIRTAEGRYVNPRNSPLRVDNGTPRAQTDSTLRPLPEVEAGDPMWSPEGEVFLTESLLAEGGEACIFTLKDHPDHLAKLFTQISDRKEAKCRLLSQAKSDFPCPGAVLPETLLYDAQGRFRGYVMHKVHGVELTRLLTYRGQQAYAGFWNRAHYANLAAAIADKLRDFSLAGLHIGDIAPANILVGYNDSGTLSSDKIFFIDLDSAQFGSNKTGIFPPDGLTAEYAAPEYLLEGVTCDDLRTQGSMVFSAALLCLQLCMGGVHPFRKTVTQEGRSFSIAQSIAESAFPYSAGSNSRKALSPDGAEKLWSNLSSDMKRFFYDLFQRGGSTNALDRRPSFFSLSKVLNGYVNWIERPDTQKRYPEALSLTPQALKPFYARCAHHACRTPEAEFVVTEFRSDGRYFCPDCLERIRNSRSAAPAPQIAPEIAPEPAPQPKPAPPSAPKPASQPKPAPQTAFNLTPPPAPKPAPKLTLADKVARFLGL